MQKRKYNPCSLRRNRLLKDQVHITEVKVDYPAAYEGLPSWKDQLDQLRSMDAFESLDANHVKEQFEFWESNPVWKKKYQFPLAESRVSLWEGYSVTVFPGKFAKKLGYGDLWKDFAKDVNEIKEGLRNFDFLTPRFKAYGNIWGRILEEAVFSELAVHCKYSWSIPFVNELMGKMNNCHFLPSIHTENWYKRLEERWPGDFLLRPFNFGRRTRGFATWVAEQEAFRSLDGMPVSSWFVAQMILLSPQRIFDVFERDRYSVNETHLSEERIICSDEFWWDGFGGTGRPSTTWFACWRDQLIFDRFDTDHGGHKASLPIVCRDPHKSERRTR